MRQYAIATNKILWNGSAKQIDTILLVCNLDYALTMAARIAKITGTYTVITTGRDESEDIVSSYHGEG